MLSSSETNASLFWYQVCLIYSFFVDNNQFSCLFIFLVIGTFAKTINKRSLRNADSFSHGNSVWIYLLTIVCINIALVILRCNTILLCDKRVIVRSWLMCYFKRMLILKYHINYLILIEAVFNFEICSDWYCGMLFFIKTYIFSMTQAIRILFKQSVLEFRLKYM